MKTKVKGNNKGFSLVELIVVIAIMGILAVTLAPRLSQYVEKARVASDREAVNTIFTAAKLANVEYPVGPGQTLKLGSNLTTDTVFCYDTTGRVWTLNTITADPDDTTDTISLDFYETMMAVLGKFNLKSNAVSVDPTTGVETQITLATDASGNLSVTLDYDGDGVVNGSDYVVEE